MKSVAKYHGSFTDRLHKPFGLDAETAPALWIILGGALAALAIIMLTHGNVIAAFAVLITIGLVALTFYRIDYSLFALLGCVMLFDQYHIRALSLIHSV
jgi:hypothetical protein